MGWVYLGGILTDEFADYAQDVRLMEPSEGKRCEWRKQLMRAGD